MAEAPAAKPRLAWVDTGRGIAILLVVLYHSTTWLSSVGLPLAGWTRVDEALVALRMPLFFTAAGLFAGKWAEVSWERLWRGKLSLFAWVLLVWSAIGAGFFLLGLQAQGNCCSARGLALLAGEVVLAPVSPRQELWFVWALAVFFVLARLTRRLDARVVLLGAAVLCLLTAGHLDLGSIGWTKAPQYWFFFVLGSRARTAVLSLGAARARVLAVGAALWAVAVVTAATTGSATTGPVPALLAGAGVVAGVAASRALVRVRALAWLGARTLPVYLAHTPVIITVAALLSLTGAVPHLARAGGLLVPVVAALAVGASLLLHRCVRLGFLYEPPRAFVDGAVAVLDRVRWRGRRSPTAAGPARRP